MKPKKICRHLMSEFYSASQTDSTTYTHTHTHIQLSTSPGQINLGDLASHPSYFFTVITFIKMPSPLVLLWKSDIAMHPSFIVQSARVSVWVYVFYFYFPFSIARVISELAKAKREKSCFDWLHLQLVTRCECCCCCCCCCCFTCFSPSLFHDEPFMAANVRVPSKMKDGVDQIKAQCTL